MRLRNRIGKRLAATAFAGVVTVAGMGVAMAPHSLGALKLAGTPASCYWGGWHKIASDEFYRNKYCYEYTGYDWQWVNTQSEYSEFY